ncbi:MAG TPA: GNAT family N-acetyltransferase [Stellaceae bacterium]|nr:GNAT family N-acetyltransferase [Stellaceae bacterium]
MAALDDPDFNHLPRPVAALFARAAARSFFALPIWYHVLARYGTDKGNVPRLYVDGAARGALACRMPGPGARRLAGLANYYSTEHGPIYGDAAALPQALDEIAREISADGIEAVRLPGLDPADPGFAALESAFRRTGFAVHRYFDSGTWFENTAGMDFDRYVAARPASLRNTWQRKNRKLESAGRMTLDFHDDAARIEQGVDDYQRIYAASWQESEPFPEFMPHLIRAAAEAGALRLGILKLDGEPAATQCWILWDGRATIYKLAHDRRFDDLSVGTILSMRMMERVLENDRPREVDLGRGDDPYKKLWLSQRRERWGLVAFNPRTPAGRLLAWREAAAGAAKRLLGLLPPGPRLR